MKKKLLVKPGLIIPVTITFALVLIAVTAFDIYQSYRDIYLSKSEEAVSLLRAVQKSGENAYLGSVEVESLIEDRLVNSADLISRLEERKPLSQDVLNKISEDDNIDHIYFFSFQGRPEILNSNKPYSELKIYDRYKDEIDSITTGKYDYFVAGSIPDQNGNAHLLILHKRIKDPGGIIALSVEADYLLDFRKKIGVGRLFQKIAEGKDIEYIVIQDSTGIITASLGVEKLNPIESDRFLLAALNSKKISTREIVFNNKKVFEAVKPFRTGNEISGIIRIGLSLDPVRSLLNWVVLRSILISFLLLLIGTIVIVYIANSQSYSDLKNEYRRMQSYTEKVLDNMSDAVVVTDKTGKINLFNKAAETIFDIRSDDISGKNCRSLIAGEQNLIDKTLSSKTPVDYFEHFVQTKNGRQIIIGGSTSIIFDNSGEIEFVVAVLRDLTAQRNEEEARKRNEKLSAMGELAGGVAHEIKNPLNIIGINAQRLEMEFTPLEDREEYLGLIKIMMDEVLRVKNIIDQFLKFAKPQKIKKEKTNVKELMENTFISFQSRAAKQGIRFSCACDEVISAYLDFGQMGQVLKNLLENAFDAVGENGQVSLEAFTDDNRLIIKVTDNGMGIKEEDLNKIFNIYYTTKSNGTGLGLSIVNQIITEHGGVVKVSSSTKTGTAFIIEVPLA